MITFDVPGQGSYTIENLVLDYNGTIAADGRIIEEIKPLLSQLAQQIDIFVVTADTYGTASKECAALGITAKTYPREGIAKNKQQLVEQLGAQHTAAFGNGCNDVAMLDVAALSVAVLESEGMYAPLLGHAHILVRSMAEGLQLLLNPKHIIADLRT